MYCEMKPCYESLKEIRVDVNEIWRKILDFGASIGLLPLILIVSWKETPVMKCLKEIGVDVNEIWGKMSDFGGSIGLLPLIFIVLCKWNPFYKVFERNRSWFQSDMKENVVF